MEGERPLGRDGIDYEDIRRKLAERGYLHGPLERFLLRDLVAHPRRRVTGTLIAAAKAALVAGPLLGAMIAGAVALANRPLLAAGDLVRLWLYFTPLAAALLVGLDLLAAMVAVARARRRGARSGNGLRAVLLVGLPVFAYLLLLARGGSGTWGYEALLFLGLAGAAALLVSRLAGLVSLVGIVGRTGEVPRKEGRTVATLVAGAMLVAAAVWWVQRVTGPPDARPASPIEVAGTGARLLLMGLDGLDGDLVQALEPRGALPHLLEVMELGAVFPLRRPDSAEPAQVWTTLTTGVEVAEHGVRGAAAARLPGVVTPLQGEGLSPGAILRLLLPLRTVPASGATRTVRAAWEIVGLRQRCLAVGWWASWPATETGEAFVVTDRVLPKLLSEAPPDRDTAPEALFDRLRADFARRKSRLREEFDTAFRDVEAGPWSGWLWESFLIDAHAAEVTGQMLEDGTWSAGFIYLPGLEILRHRLRTHAGGADLGGTLAAHDALVAYVRWLDGIVGRLGDLWRDETLLLVADRGRGGDPTTDGFLVVRGPTAVPACIGPTLDPVDVLPTLLALIGFPTSLELAGMAAPVCLDYSPEPPPVATFGRRSRPKGGIDSDYDPEMVERLRSLGYLN